MNIQKQNVYNNNVYDNNFNYLSKIKHEKNSFILDSKPKAQEFNHTSTIKLN